MRRIASVFLLIACLATVVTAQVPRMALVEEATNASCGPCAAQNPTFEHYLAQPQVRARAIPVVFHANWPGKDVMNAANPTMHNNRIAYYSISGVPTAVVNGAIPVKSSGGYNGAPSDTVALTRDITATPATSPISITIAEQVNGANGSVDVTVSSASAVSGAKLRIALVEGYHYYTNAGSNGEKDFVYIARKMLPSETGTDLSLAANETKTFTQPFTIDAAWTANELYFVAFVQTDATKEVLQAATDKLDLQLTSSGATSAINANANDPVEFTGTLATPVDGSFSVQLDKSLPENWTTVVRIDNTDMSQVSSVTVLKDAPAAVSVTINPGVSLNRAGSVTLTIKGPRGSSVVRTYRLYARNITVLGYVRDEGVADIAKAYSQALDKGMFTYALLSQADEAMFDPKAYPAMLMETGKNILSQQDVGFLKSYIDRGGRLFIAGAEIGWGLVDPASGQYGYYMDQAFFQNYLHATYVQDDNPSGTVKGVPGDVIGDGFNFSFTDGVQNQDTPDEIAPRDNAVPIFTYSNSASAVAGIRYDDGNNKLVYLGFGLEGVGLTITRAEVLKRGIAWLLGVSDVEAPAGPQSLRVGDLYPNPAASAWSIPVTLTHPARIRIDLYDAAGRDVATLADAEAEPGMHAYSFDASRLLPGAYLVHVAADGRTTTRMLTVQR